MKKRTKSEAVAGPFVCGVMLVGCALDVWRNAQKGAWGWFWFSMVATVFFSGIVGWLAIDAFNGLQKRRRAAQKAD